MHMGHQIPAFNNTMNGQKLEETKEERDIGVIVAANMKQMVQCTHATNTAQKVRRQLACAFHYRDRHIFLNLYVYKHYERSHLEFFTQAWAPWTDGDRDWLEKVQQKMVKMKTSMRRD